MRNPETRIYGTTLAQPFHTDISDIVGECGMGSSPNLRGTADKPLQRLPVCCWHAARSLLR